MDSFSIAFVRDQEKDRKDVYLFKINDSKNAELLLWTFKNYDYPSLQKIGLWGNNDVFMPMLSLYLHMPSQDRYLEIQQKLLEYVKSGDCPPRDYAGMVDRHLFKKKMKRFYMLTILVPPPFLIL